MYFLLTNQYTGKVKDLVKDNKDHFGMIVDSVENVRVAAFNLYVPNKGYPQFFQKLTSLLAE